MIFLLQQNPYMFLECSWKWKTFICACLRTCQVLKTKLFSQNCINLRYTANLSKPCHQVIQIWNNNFKFTLDQNFQLTWPISRKQFYSCIYLIVRTQLWEEYKHMHTRPWTSTCPSTSEDILNFAVVINNNTGTSMIYFYKCFIYVIYIKYTFI